MRKNSFLSKISSIFIKQVLNLFKWLHTLLRLQFINTFTDHIEAKSMNRDLCSLFFSSMIILLGPFLTPVLYLVSIRIKRKNSLILKKKRLLREISKPNQSSQREQRNHGQLQIPISIKEIYFSIIQRASRGVI